MTFTIDLADGDDQVIINGIPIEYRRNGVSAELRDEPTSGLTHNDHGDVSQAANSVKGVPEPHTPASSQNGCERVMDLNQFLKYTDDRSNAALGLVALSGRGAGDSERTHAKPQNQNDWPNGVTDGASLNPFRNDRVHNQPQQHFQSRVTGNIQEASHGLAQTGLTPGTPPYAVQDILDDDTEYWNSVYKQRPQASGTDNAKDVTDHDKNAASVSSLSEDDIPLSMLHQWPLNPTAVRNVNVEHKLDQLVFPELRKKEVSTHETLQ